jgi:hypothetical protein
MPDRPPPGERSGCYGTIPLRAYFAQTLSLAIQLLPHRLPCLQADALFMWWHFWPIAIQLLPQGLLFLQLGAASDNATNEKLRAKAITEVLISFIII